MQKQSAKNLQTHWDPKLHRIQQSKDGQNAFVMEERMSMTTLDHTDENIERVRQVIEDDRHSTYDDIMAETSLSPMVQLNELFMRV